MRPPPASAIAGASAVMRRMGPITCSSHCSCQSASVSSSGGRARLVPALLTSAQGGPSQAASSRSPASGSVTSSLRPPPLRATDSTRAPSCASMPAVAAPMPREAPVTTQSLPFSPRSMSEER